MPLTGIEIFKLLPKTNCGECGVPTCLADFRENRTVKPIARQQIAQLFVPIVTEFHLDFLAVWQQNPATDR